MQLLAASSNESNDEDFFDLLIFVRTADRSVATSVTICERCHKSLLPTKPIFLLFHNDTTTWFTRRYER
jgi:hypothetical protein